MNGPLVGGLVTGGVFLASMLYRLDWNLFESDSEDKITLEMMEFYFEKWSFVENLKVLSPELVPEFDTPMSTIRLTPDPRTRPVVRRGSRNYNTMRYDYKVRALLASTRYGTVALMLRSDQDGHYEVKLSVPSELEAFKPTINVHNGTEFMKVVKWVLNADLAAELSA